MGNIFQKPKNNLNTNKEVYSNSNANVDEENINYQYQYQPQRGYQETNGLRLLNDKPQHKDKKVVAVIISFCCNSSYDSLFTTVQQKSIEGTKVEVYACSSFYLPSLIQAFEGKPQDEVATRLMKTIKEVDPDCVVLNWECSSGYGSKNFPEKADKLFYFLKMAIQRGHMTMFSDFSLKALVNQWKDKHQIGPNPFVQTTELSGQFTIRFNPSELKQCPSAQLQTIGDMAEEGMCKIIAAGGTIVYCVDSTKLNHKHYKLQTLTVVPNMMPNQQKLISKIGAFEGSAGHVLLTYPTGGMILTSMGHWVELMKIDTSPQKVFEVAEKQFGYAKAEEMRNAYSGMNEMAQKEYISQNAMDFVKNQAPCSNMVRKNRSK